MNRDGSYFRHPTAPRRGHTLIELVVAMTSAAVLTAGMGGTLYLASHALNDGGSNAVQQAKDRQVLERIMDDVELALLFSERTNTAIEFTVPDRDADGQPETIRYAWSGVPGDPLTYEYNGSAPTVIADDVQQFDLQTETRFMAAPLPPVPEGKALLFVVTDTTTPTAQESIRQALFETWGYTVTLIDDDDSQGNFDAAVAENDVAYVSCEVDELLGAKLQNAAIGVVNEEWQHVADLGFASQAAFASGATGILVIDNTQYITAPFDLSTLTIFASGQSIGKLGGTLAPDLATLATDPAVPTEPTLATLDAGAVTWDAGTTAGRRAQLPWGTTGFDINAVNTEGQTIIKRALEWAGGANLPVPDPIFGYDTIFIGARKSVHGVQVATQVTLPEDGTLKSITAYINGRNTLCRAAIYTDSGGEPGTLVVQSDPEAKGATDWYTFTVPDTPLTAGTYWLAVSFSDRQQQYFYESSGGQVRHVAHDAVNNGFLATWGASSESNPYKVSIYGTYTVGP
jgi:hypothetical protein